MFELLIAVLIAAALGAVAGGVAAFTHQVFITKAVANVKADIAKLEALKGKL